MSRPIKDGVDYFPLDADFFQDDKIRLIKGEFGAKGIVILLYILCEIYREKGYYKVWDKDACLLMADAVGCGIVPENITQVVQGCLRRSVFDDGVFQMFGILTSAGIQRRYIRAVSTREQIPAIREYWLLDMDDRKDVPASVLNKVVFKTIHSEKTPESLKKTPVSLQINPQSKGKERNTPLPPKGDGGFERFWLVYPKRKGKEAARKAFAKLEPDNELLGVMIAAIRQEMKSDQWRRNGGQYIPYPATWLNQRRWEDEPDKPLQEDDDIPDYLTHYL